MRRKTTFRSSKVHILAVIMRKSLLSLAAIFTLVSACIAQSRNDAASQIPVMAWLGIPAEETSVSRYQEMKDAGITHQLTFFPNADALQKALDVAAKVGIRMVVSCPELRTDPQGTARRFKNHPAVEGYHLMDEPPISMFPSLGEWARKIRSVDSTHFCYVNLFPALGDHDTLRFGTNDYRKYIRACATQVPLKFLSFDYYPVLKDGLADSWFLNLEQIADESRKAGMPFWAFALTTNYDDAKVAPQTLASLRVQVYCNLAYGAQGMEYFTYWSATSLNAPSSEDQRGAPITANGKRSVVYDRIKQMSMEIRNLSSVFLGSKVVWVRHTGRGMIPKGTIRLTKLPDAIKVLEGNGAPLLVSLLEKGNEQFLVVVNKDFQHTVPILFLGDSTVMKVLKDGSRVPASDYESAQDLEPGDVVIFAFPNSK